MIKQLYKLLPFKKQLFTLLRPLGLPERLYRHLWFKGVIMVKVEDNSFRIYHHGYSLENELFWKGIKGWDAHALEKWIALSKTAKVILDVGANTGIFSLVAGAVSSATIYAFEPVERVYNKLQRNVEMNQFNIQTFRVAASNENGTTILYDNTEEHNLSASLNPNHRPGSIEKIVKTQTLDSFCTEHDLKVDLVKIDVERFETEVMEGFMQVVKRDLPTILIEVLDIEIGERISQLLDGLPYKYYSIHEERGIEPVESLATANCFNYLISL